MMKKAIIALLIVVVYISCKKQNDGPGEIYGRWKLTESLADPGDGSGKYEKVAGSPKYLGISPNGKITGEVFPEVLRYKILDSTRLELTYKDDRAPVVFWYKATAKTLVLGPLCIEPCGLRFVRD